jgi:uncharacterized protein
MKPGPVFSPAQAERLEAFFGAAQRPPDGMRYPEVAGFLFAVACAPEMALPSQWLPIVLSEDGTGDVGMAEVQEVLGAIMALYNATNDGVRRGEPVLPPGVAPRSPVADNLAPDSAVSLWARGFSAGYDWIREAWTTHTPEELNEPLGASVLVLSFFASRGLAEAYRREIRADATLEQTAEEMLRLFPQAMEDHAHIGNSIFEALRAQQAAPGPARGDKVGRNDPCPCGSGKKYKKCCGAGVH